MLYKLIDWYIAHMEKHMFDKFADFDCIKCTFQEGIPKDKHYYKEIPSGSWYSLLQYLSIFGKDNGIYHMNLK